MERKLPGFHVLEDSSLSPGFSSEDIALLEEFLRANKVRNAVETGAGNSTVAFLSSGLSKVVSVVPDLPLIERVEDYCNSEGISLQGFSPIVGLSQWELPKLCATLGGTFDFGLVDGEHGWPLAFIDFYYIDFLVRVGGFVMLDDFRDLHSVREISNWLSEEPGFKVSLEMRKSVIYQKVPGRRLYPNWCDQPYLVGKSKKA